MSCRNSPSTAPRAGVLTVALVAILQLHASPSAAGICGDDVEGARVACACGDIVVSDTTLRAGDPVASGRCPLDGLVVRAAPAAESITLDLGGLALVGEGFGHGILVERGGSDGAVIVGGAPGRKADIVGFATGVTVPNPVALRRLERVHVKGSRFDGLRIRQQGAHLIDVESSNNGRDGMRVMGSGGRLIGVRTDGNGGAGVRSVGRGTVIEAESTNNRRTGILVHGSRGDAARSVATGNGGAGIVFSGGRHASDGASAGANARGQVLAGPRREEQR